MKTLLLTLEYPPFKGGVANYYGNLVKYWPEPGGIFVLDNQGEKLVKSGLPFLKWLPAVSALKKEIKKQGIGHVIVGQILPLGLPAVICGVKFSVILHGTDFSLAMRSWRKKIVARLVLGRADRIICANSYTAGQVKAFLGNGKKIATVNPGADAPGDNHTLTDQLRKKYGLENKTVLLSVGRLVERKGFDKVIEALPSALKQAGDLNYVIVGQGEIPRIRPELRDKIIIISDAGDEERNAWYEICDIFIMPSRNINGDYEGFGIVYLEANLAGKPVIAGRSGGAGDAVIDDINGLTVDPENSDEISQAVVRLALNSDLRKKLGEQGRERALKDFNWEKQIGKIYEVITNNKKRKL